MVLGKSMENRFVSLVEGNMPENRAKWALHFKERGKGVIGVLTPYVPEEVIAAADLLPWGVSGTWGEGAPHAAIYRPEMTCRYCSHVLESILIGELDFLDGIIMARRDDDFKVLADVLNHIKKPPFTHIMYLPQPTTKGGLDMWINSVLELKKVVQERGGKEVGADRLRQTIQVYNTTRLLLRKVYELRKRREPPITGAEVLGIVTASKVMPKEEFNRQLEGLLPWLESRRANLRRSRPRLLLSSDYLDNTEYINLVEEAGSVVVMDDLDAGSRYFWTMVDIPSDNLWEAVARRYLYGVSCPRMDNWDEQLEQLINWCQEFDIDGVVELLQLYSFPRQVRSIYAKEKLAQAGIPYITLHRDYALTHTGMLKTRIEAFIEMIGVRG